VPVLLLPKFLSPTTAANGQYVAVTVAEDDVALAAGVYCLTAYGCAVSFSTDMGLDGTNGAHIPNGDTRMVVFEEAGSLFFIRAVDETADGKLNIAKVFPNPSQLFYT
jgi:hypothetical protein